MGSSGRLAIGRAVRGGGAFWMLLCGLWLGDLINRRGISRLLVGACVQGGLQIGSVREVNVKSGLPATTSTERLELLDDEEHIFRMTIVGGDHRLKNYSSIITVHAEVIDGRPGTVVIESFVVDVPDGNTKDETCYFVEALIKCNLKSLANVSERLAVQDRTEPIDRI
ncbi:hypothetical protein GH714_005841 [Hevea brasiliensis]|uniref:Bet v I/Major latex protein domain-containing protein n=1 Tax=Hevea brasiliensis TaxID=3981 RepID=A0A6A6L917_HEVBR|nr:hypothetical protein GH714_005841 [Hevea brasiliensis]